MTTIGSYEAKTHLPALLKRVEAGESLTITRHGRPIARLVPMAESPSTSVAEAVAGLRRLRRGKALGKDLNVRDLIDSGRR
ncbi:MAG: type II toxin-antitoxin system Phd/YefM family antitoxin [Gemmatimonadetes bacterium]|nr:type II toxin-antitoxin system Phd/YefM family antitoxin [Gemmatimonadota bacterium]